MAASVEFDYNEFIEVYPQFKALSETACSFAFKEAELYLDHILTLKERGVSVGQVASASEGSVSVSYSVPNLAGAEYFGQTQCGLAFWQAVKPYLLGGRYYARH